MEVWYTFENAHTSFSFYCPTSNGFILKCYTFFLLGGYDILMSNYIPFWNTIQLSVAKDLQSIF